MKISAGQLDRQVTIERKSSAQDAVYGAPTDTWLPLIALPGSPTAAGKVWAQVQDVLPSRQEGITEQVVIGRQLARMRIRYRSDLDSSMRVTVHFDSGDEVFSIIGGPSMIGRREYTECLLEKYSSNG